MISDTVMFQHVHGSSECEEWLELTVPLTLRYCRRWKIDYYLINSDLWIGADVPGHWALPEQIMEFMCQDYKNIIYLDADCIVYDQNVDPRDAIVPGHIGAVWHDLAYHAPDWSHFNDGALYVSVSPETRRFVEVWNSLRPGFLTEFEGLPDSWWEQGVMNVLGRATGTLKKIDNRWNAGHVSPSDSPVIYGLHGLPDRLENIQLRVEEARKKL